MRPALVPTICVVLSAACLLLSTTVPAVTYATSSEWTLDSPVTTSGDGHLWADITHSGNNLIQRITLPYVRVLYPDGTNFADQFRSTYCVPQPSCTPTVDNSLAGKTIYTTEYYVIYSVNCQPGNWNHEGCYRYKEIFELWDVDAGGAGSAARFRPVIQAFGPGLSEPGNWPTYNPYWRIDTELPGGTNNEYLREKSNTCSTQWNDIVFEEALTPLCSSGQVWRQHDYATGWSKSIGVLPVSSNPVLTALRYHSGQDDPTGDSLFDPDNPDIWVSGEIIYVDNQILWFKATEQSGSTHCYPGNPCKVQSAWILNGQPPW